MLGQYAGSVCSHSVSAVVCCIASDHSPWSYKCTDEKAWECVGDMAIVGGIRGTLVT